MTTTDTRDTPTSSRDVIVREEEFRSLLSRQSQDFGGCVAAIRVDLQLLQLPLVMARLAKDAHDLETFLDNFGARQNRTYVTFGEMVASTRGLAAVGSTALHLGQRLKRYQVVIDRAPLSDDLRSAQSRLTRALQQLLGALVEEGEQLDCKWTLSAIDRRLDVPQRHLLPRNLDESEAVDERQHIAEIGTRFLKVLETSRSLNLGSVRPKEDLVRFVSEHATEERCRWYESSVHSIQSMYDTFVLNTVIERDHPWLSALRGHVSVALHLLEMATGLMHFYERHEGDVRHAPASRAIAAVVSKDDILDIAVNVCLRHAYLYVESASSVAHQILQTFVSRAAVSLVMPAGVTLHARPLALIVQVARHYGTPLELSLDGESCSANSLMSLILLGGRHPRPRLIRVQGDARALRDLELLFASGLGEQGRPLAPGLEYLRVGG